MEMAWNGLKKDLYWVGQENFIGIYGESGYLYGETIGQIAHTLL
jgi:hypothetical protein